MTALASHVSTASHLTSRTLLAMMVLALTSACVEEPPASPPVSQVVPEPPRPRPEDLGQRQAALRESRAERTRAANSAARAAAASPASRNMQDYLKGVEDTLQARGLLRTDGGTEIALTAEQLTEDFVTIALHDEYVRDGDKLISRSTPAPLRRWAQPVRMHIEFGDSVPSAQRARDRAAISDYASRLRSASGHPVSLETGPGNMNILIVNEDERRVIGPRLAALVPGIPESDVAALENLAPQNYCTVFAYSRGNSLTYDQAVVLIRTETPPRLRRSCIHEEIAQGLGLANDSRQVRPSIFNDDEEFAYLTRHDELLLKILYDPRLRPGMTEAEARPIVLNIARELLATST